MNAGMYAEQEIAQNLRDAGCGRKEIETIMDCWREGNLQGMEKRIAAFRREQLDRLHESQKRIDRLDYLSYRLQHE